MDSNSTVTSFIKELVPRNQKQDKNTEWVTKNQNKTSETELDPNCIVQINKRLVRIEYPGEVRDVEKAIETLGGLEGIEASVAEHGCKLELHFHPRNKFNKPCFADKDFRPGILINVKRKVEPGRNDVKYDYDIEGVAVMNFTFNRLCDFQYLPLVAKLPETSSSTTDYIYDKILPRELPSLDWLTNDVAKNMEEFLVPVRFSHHDSSQSKLSVDTDKTEQKLKLRGAANVPLKLNSKQQKSVCRIFRKTRHKTSIFVNFKDKDVPMEPLEHALKLLKHRNLETHLGKVRKLFEERPIWTKAAIRHITGLSDEHSKIILPAVAYYFLNGPWRITWVKFGYDPRKDPKARIYQTLDYRIRTAESTKLKVSAKRNYSGKTSIFSEMAQKKVSLKHDMSTRPKTELDERHYVLRPLTIPPARQMFYQFCDLLLPRIQDLISRLPESQGFCHPKNGFLPENFIETCRGVVNENVLEAVQKELLEDKKVLQEQVIKEKETKDSASHLDYYNQMLSNIKRGLYKNVGLQPVLSKEIDPDELISLSSDEENDEYTVGEIIQSAIPETLEAEEDDHSDISDFSDEPEIDMEAVQEINEMMSQFNEQVLK